MERFFFCHQESWDDLLRVTGRPLQMLPFMVALIINGNFYLI